MLKVVWGSVLVFVIFLEMFYKGKERMGVRIEGWVGG